MILGTRVALKRGEYENYSKENGAYEIFWKFFSFIVLNLVLSSEWGINSIRQT